jgi:regulator of replication initiation timing
MKDQLAEFQPEIRQIKRNLTRIKETGTAPVNITQFRKRLGLIKKPTTDKKGKVKLTLTEKGKRILKTPF